MSNPMIGKLIGRSCPQSHVHGGRDRGRDRVSLRSVCWVSSAGPPAASCSTVLIAYGVILPMYAIAGERRERTRLFVLSLPVSRGDYVLAKVLGVTLTFLIPWTVLLIGAWLLILATPMPDGLIVFTTLLMTFALADFGVIACAAMLIHSEGGMAVVIVFMNMSVTFMVGIRASHASART